MASLTPDKSLSLDTETQQTTKPHRPFLAAWHYWPRWKRYVVVGLSLGTVAVIIALAGSLSSRSSKAPNLGSLHTGLTILMNNDLENYAETDALIMMGTPKTHDEANQQCTYLNERLATSPPSLYGELLPRLQNRSSTDQWYWVAARNATACQAVNGQDGLMMTSCNRRFPSLCTQSAPAARVDYADLSRAWHIEVPTRKNGTVRGYRDRRSFRFMGIPYAPKPARWVHSQVRNSTEAVEALKPGARCKQSDVPTSSEDCLFLNVYTPFLPYSEAVAPELLRPVMVFIHGGSFVNGDASDPFADGGSLASRGDVLLVSVNYRLGVFGWLALDDGETNGNYGLGDQITALRWVKKNIRAFGGDPDRVTIFGQSAGASAVRALLASPLTSTMFAGAIMQSGPAGLGMGAPYAKYLSIPEAMGYMDPVLTATDCASARSRIRCLSLLSADELVTLGSDNLRLDGVNQAFLVRDGNMINSSGLTLNASGETSAIPLILGNMRDDGAFFLPDPGQLNLTSSLLAAPLSLSDRNASDLASYARSSPLGGLLPVVALNSTDKGAQFDIYNVTNRLSTLGTFECDVRATAFAASLTGAFNRTYIYEMNRAFNYYPETQVCNAMATKQFPNGNPYTSLDCHSGDNPYMFGNLKFMNFNIRDEYDYPFARQMLDMWASFARTGDPNPEPDWMRIMGYELDYGLNNQDLWAPTYHGSMDVRRLGPISSAMIPTTNDYITQACQIMGLPLDLYT